MLHIGIAACSSEGAALCYRTVCAEGMVRLGGHRHPEVTMHTPPLSDYEAALGAGDLDAVAGLMLASARKLAAVGADFLICPDNTIHAAIDRVRAASPLPWLHIAGVVAGEARRIGARRPAVLGTRWLVESEVYPQALAAEGLDWAIPEEADRAEVDRIILTELVLGRVTEESRERLEAIVRDMAGAGCDAVILGCTELPLILGEGLPVPALDSTRLLARAALDHALTGARAA
jgi:aspartate racemase